METSYNFDQYLREHPFETWEITKTLNSPRFIQKVIGPRILYHKIFFQDFRVFHPENCMDFLTEVILQFPKTWDISEILFIEEDTTDKPLKRGYPDLYTIYRVDNTGSTDPVNLDFLKNLQEEATIFSYYDCNGFLNIVTIQKA